MLKRWICKTFHSSIMYIGGNKYECRTCRLRWPSPWITGKIKQDEKVVPQTAPEVR